MTVQLYTAQLRAVPYRKTVNRAWCSRAMLHAILVGDSDWGPLCVERGLTSSGPLVLRALRRHHADMAARAHGAATWAVIFDLDLPRGPGSADARAEAVVCGWTAE